MRDEYQELMICIRYGVTQVRSKRWNLGQYYNYMAKFFDRINLPKDAEEHRNLAKIWEFNI